MRISNIYVEDFQSWDVIWVLARISDVLGPDLRQQMNTSNCEHTIETMTESSQN